MKKLAVILVLVLVASALWAQDYGKYGIGANIGIETDVDSDIADVTTTDNLMTFIPAFSMMLSESMELMPFLIIASDTHSESDNPAADSLDLTLGAGCGLHWYPIRAKHFRLGTGGTIQIHDKFQVDGPDDFDNRFSLDLFVPLIIEVPLMQWLSFRAHLDIVGIGMEYRSWDTGTGSQSQFDFDLYTVFFLYYFQCGVYYRFG